MPFKKGQSGNPAGRPPNKKFFSDAARELLASNEIDISWKFGDDNKSLNLSSDSDIAHGLAATLIVEGLSGNVQAIKELVDRTEGKATDNKKVDLSGSLGGMDYKKKMDKLIGLMAGIKSK